MSVVWMLRFVKEWKQGNRSGKRQGAKFAKTEKEIMEIKESIKPTAYIIERIVFDGQAVESTGIVEAEGLFVEV